MEIANDNVLVSCHGRVNTEGVSMLLKGATASLKERNISKGVRKRVYLILLEGIQNCLKHGDEAAFDEMGNTKVSLEEHHNSFDFSFGNYMLASKKEELQAKLKMISRLSPKELKLKYREILTNGKQSEIGGSGLGLLDIARKSGNKLEYSFECTNEELCFFTLKVKFMKLEDLKIEKSAKTPIIKFLAEKGEFLLEGISVPENAKGFYEPIINWLNEYTKSPAPKTSISIKLEYFNTSSSKSILDLLRKFEFLAKKRLSETAINWIYEFDDDDMLETALSYDEIIEIPFNYIPVKEI